MTREDLKEYKYNQEWIKGRLEYIEEYRTSITNITSILSDMPKGSKQVQDSMAEKVATLLDNVNELMSKIVKEQEKQRKILEQLNHVEQPYRLILEKNYVQGEKLVQVACDLKYNYEYTKKANSIGLKKFDELDEIFPKSY